jgi:hypothetical protein
MPEVGFEPTITTSERAKTIHALDCTPTVTGFIYLFTYLFICLFICGVLNETVSSSGYIVSNDKIPVKN